MRLKDIKLKVRTILETQPEARDNDGHLIAHYTAKYYPQLISAVPDPRGEEKTIKMIQLSNFRHMPPSESITRARRIIQNKDDEFLPRSAAVRKARRIKEANYRNWEVREAENTKAYPDGV